MIDKTKFRVICPDECVRHDAFDTRAEAAEFVEWGHACLRASMHRIEEVNEEGAGI